MNLSWNSNLVESPIVSTKLNLVKSPIGVSTMAYLSWKICQCPCISGAIFIFKNSSIVEICCITIYFCLFLLDLISCKRHLSIYTSLTTDGQIPEEESDMVDNTVYTTDEGMYKLWFLRVPLKNFIFKVMKFLEF